MSTAYIVCILILHLFSVLSICQISTSIGMLVNYISPFDTYYTAKNSSSTCRQEIYNHEKKLYLTAFEQSRANQFCRDNEILTASGSLGILSGTLIFASTITVYFSKFRVTTWLLAIASLLSVTSFVIPFLMRAAGQDNYDPCSAAVQKLRGLPIPIFISKNLKIPIVHGVYTCWKGGIHNFHNMSSQARVNNVEKKHMFLSAVIFLSFTFVSMCITPPAAAILFFYDRRINKVKMSPSSSYNFGTVTNTTASLNEEIQTALKNWRRGSASEIQVSRSHSRTNSKQPE